MIRELERVESGERQWKNKGHNAIRVCCILGKQENHCGLTRISKCFSGGIFEKETYGNSENFDFYSKDDLKPFEGVDQGNAII